MVDTSSKPGTEKPSQYPRVTDVSKVVVGQMYSVFCIWHIDDHRKPIPQWIPIVGTVHSDSGFGFGHHLHAHYDFRFVAQGTLDWIDKYVDDKDDEESYARLHRYLYVVELGSKETLETITTGYQDLPCLRQLEEIYPLETCGFMLSKLEPHFADKRVSLKRPVCPHRGVCLKGMPHSKSAVVCPAHGLAWSLRTGKMVRRYRVKPGVKDVKQLSQEWKAYEPDPLASR